MDKRLHRVHWDLPFPAGSRQGTGQASKNFSQYENNAAAVLSCLSLVYGAAKFNRMGKPKLGFWSVRKHIRKRVRQVLHKVTVTCCVHSKLSGEAMALVRKGIRTSLNNCKPMHPYPVNRVRSIGSSLSDKTAAP